MKHRQAVRPRPPDAIAAEVRAQVERSLALLDFAPPVPGFLDRISKFAAKLALWGARSNLTARPGDPEDVAFHIVDSLMPLALAKRADATALREAFAARKRVLDVGSGAGFPGMVLAAASKPHFTLCESRRRRASFLSVATAEMGLTNVTIAPMRAAAGAFAADFDLVTARALGDPPGFFGIAASTLRRGGVALLYATPKQPLEAKQARASGLLIHSRLEYEVDRGGESLKRALVLWLRE